MVVPTPAGLSLWKLQCYLGGRAPWALRIIFNSPDCPRQLHYLEICLCSRWWNHARRFKYTLHVVSWDEVYMEP